MFSLISAGLEAISRILLGGSPAGNANEPQTVAIINIVTVLRIIAKAFDDLFQRQKQAWTYADTEASELGLAVRDLASADNANWSHFVHVIMPHSQAWLLGAVHQWADKTFLKLSWLKSKEWTTVRDESRTAFTFWQTYHRWLHGFVHYGWPKLNQWKTRTADPQLRQLWALNPKAYPLEPVIIDKAAGYLHSAKGATDLRNLTVLFVDESPAVWRHVEAAVLAILESQYP